jgi:hypothetical protein
MGDKANIVIESDKANIVIESDKEMFPHPVFFYTHWSGSTIKDTLQAALAHKRWWDDPQYLARIIFCELVKNQPHGTTGYGISTRIGNGSHKLLCVNMEENKVRERNSTEDINAAVLHEWTFEEFVKAKFKEEDD